MVCRRKKSLYCLKQGPHASFENFRKVILQAKLSQSPNDHSLFIRRTPRRCTILLVYVDDNIISGNDDLGIRELKTYLMHKFAMKDLAQLTYYLGLEIQRTKAGIHVHQRKYAENVLSLAHL